MKILTIHTFHAAIRSVHKNKRKSAQILNVNSWKTVEHTMGHKFSICTQHLYALINPCSYIQVPYRNM